ncbi:hypothetical protein HPB51_026259 [Rhipicephalus microplus]|uniref:Uncharacterized protein n=1 Tax=Rhipicephalus microplus TaxID=6941 RepID=A0A9J6D8U1_RHIMP|nr:hypothetical protein HPB51_026259 [Rhipicephalus microplus]
MSRVKRKFFYRDWYEEGGKPDTARLYLPAQGRFEDVPELTRSEDSPWEYKCYSCLRKRREKKANSCRYGEVLSGEKNGRVFYSSVKWQKENYCVGDCIFLNPGALDHHPSKKQASPKSMDTSNGKGHEPFQVACILSIVASKTSRNQNTATFRVRKFYSVAMATIRNCKTLDFATSLKANQCVEAGEKCSTMAEEYIVEEQGG